MRLPALALAVTIAAVSCGPPGAVDPASVGPFPGAPVVLISIDTLRSDRLPAYGYTGVDTPGIDALRRDSILFRHAYSHVPLTLPSHASIFSGLLPGDHGVRDNLGYRFDASRHPHLPLRFQSRGYKTGAFVSSYVLRGETGLSSGFDVYDANIEIRGDEPLGRSQRPGSETLDKALTWLDTVRNDPFFLFLHFYEPHTPYAPPEPFASRYTDRYDGEIAASDALVSRLVETLRRNGLYDKAIVVVLSDHGEGLGDHGEPEHGIFLYREAIQVPLMLKLPRQLLAGSSVEAPTQLIDVAPTLSSLTKLGGESGGGGGTSLLAVAGARAGARRVVSETMYPRLHYGWSDLVSVIDDSLHVVHGPSPELYDLRADSRESENLASKRPDALERLTRIAGALRVPLSAPRDEDPETRERLASLGYVGSSVAVPDGDLPDPKSRIGVLRANGKAFQHFFRKEYRQAAELLEDVVRDNPRMIDAWEHLGIAFERLGRHEDARQALERAMRESGGSAQIALVLARVLLRLGEFDSAAEHARLGLAASESAGRSVLAQVALERGDTSLAESEARAALAAGGGKIGSLITLAQVEVRKRRLDEALATIEAAKREATQSASESIQGIEFIRGDILARLGRTPEAAAAFQAEIRDFPWNLQAYSRLAVLEATSGDSPAALLTLRRLCEANDSPGAIAEAVKTLRVLGARDVSEDLLRSGTRRFPESSVLRRLASS